MFKRKSIPIYIAFFSLIAIFILIKVITSIFFSGNSATKSLIQARLGKNTFSNFSYKTYDSKGHEIVLHAENVSEGEKNMYEFDKVKSTIALSNGETAIISANKIVASQKDKVVCNFIGDVQLSTSSGLLMKTEISTIDFSKKTAKGEKKISISNNDTKISADRYSVNLESKTANLFGNIKGEIFSQNNISANYALISFDNNSKDHIGYVQLSGNPTIKSKDYTLKSNGHLIYKHDLIESTSRTYLKYVYNKDEYFIKSDKMLAKLSDSKIKSIEVYGNLVINSENAIVKADKGFFYDHRAVVSGNVAIMNEHGTIFGDAANIDFNTGRVSLKKSKGILSGK